MLTYRSGKPQDFPQVFREIVTTFSKRVKNAEEIVRTLSENCYAESAEIVGNNGRR
jgi:hypothetical protein